MSSRWRRIWVVIDRIGCVKQPINWTAKTTGHNANKLSKLFLFLTTHSGQHLLRILVELFWHKIKAALMVRLLWPLACFGNSYTVFYGLGGWMNKHHGQPRVIRVWKWGVIQVWIT